VKRLNLSDSEWLHGETLDDIQKLISSGVKGTQMRPFKGVLSEDEILAVALYVSGLKDAATVTD
jgi:mono/diheme cytochrome c family protein